MARWASTNGSIALRMMGASIETVRSQSVVETSGVGSLCSERGVHFRNVMQPSIPDLKVAVECGS